VNKWLEKCVREKDESLAELRKALIQEGRNQVLYLILCIGDENVAHDHWHPDRANLLVDVRRRIVRDLRHYDETGHINTPFPQNWPDFESYTYCPG
jgi:hypothetical protein